MLEKVREPWRANKLKSILAYVIFGFICLMFAFVGITPDSGGLRGTGAVATVNNTVISMMDFQERVNMIENQMGNMDRNLPASQRQMRSRMVRENALNEMVNSEIVYQSAEQVGVLPTKSAIRDMIVNIPAFQEDGQFTRDNYDRFLTYRNTTAAEFEAKIQRDIVIGQVRDLFFTALKAPEALQNLDSQVKETKINLEFVTVTPETFAGANIDAEAVKGFLGRDENQAKVKGYYDSHKDEVTSKAEVHARHILIKGDSESSLKKIQEIRKEAEKGDFAELAKKYSEDAGSKDRGGDLNFFGRGQMVPPFEDAAFSLPIGKLSEPVKTSFGYHLIKVEERRGGEVKPLVEVQNEIAKKLMIDDIKESGLKDIAEAIKEKKDISAWLARWKLKWEETGEFSLGGYSVPKISAGDEVLEAAVKLKSVGEVYPELLHVGAQSYIIRLKKFVPGGATPQQVEATPWNLSSAGAETLQLWAEDLRKSARIRRNESALN